MIYYMNINQSKKIEQIKDNFSKLIYFFDQNGVKSMNVPGLFVHDPYNQYKKIPIADPESLDRFIATTTYDLNKLINDFIIPFKKHYIVYEKLFNISNITENKEDKVREITNDLQKNFDNLYPPYSFFSKIKNMYSDKDDIRRLQDIYDNIDDKLDSLEPTVKVNREPVISGNTTGGKSRKTMKKRRKMKRKTNKKIHKMRRKGMKKSYKKK